MVVISSGHGLLVRGARGIIDEVDEARRVTDRVSDILRSAGADVNTFHENTTRNQNDNVNAIVRHHNSQQRDLDVSIHFNSTKTGAIEERGIGVETLYFTGNQRTKQTASSVSRAISDASGLLLRRGDGTLAANVGFLRLTTAPAILIEVCFVNSQTDVRLYQQHFESICAAIASTIIGREIVNTTPPVTSPNEETLCFDLFGKALDIPGLRNNNRSFVAARPLLEALGYAVYWDDKTRVVSVRDRPQR